MRRFDAVLWDLDGTLVETRRDITTAVNLLLADRRLPPMSITAVSTCVGRGARVLVTRCLQAAGISQPGDEEVERAYEDFRVHYTAHMLDTSDPYPGVPELLGRLCTAGLMMGVVSNKPEEMTRRLVEGLQLSQFFAGILGGDSLAARKPDPGPLLHMKEKLGAAQDRCVMVGDMDIDVEAARAAGIACAAVAWGFSSKEKLLAVSPDLLADNPGVLGEWILG